MKTWSAGEQINASDLNSNFVVGARFDPIDLPDIFDGNSNYISAIAADFNDSTPDYIFTGKGAASGDFTIRQLVRLADGAYEYQGVSATITPNNAGYNNVNMLGMACDGTYLYVYFQTNNSGAGHKDECIRLAMSDLTGATSMTGLPTLTTNPISQACFFYDPVTAKFYKLHDATTVKEMTVSGSAFTVTATRTLSVGLSNALGVLLKKANGNILIIDYNTATATQTLREYGSTGTQLTALTKTLSANSSHERVFGGVLNINGETRLALFEVNYNNSATSTRLVTKYFGY